MRFGKIYMKDLLCCLYQLFKMGSERFSISARIILFFLLSVLIAYVVPVYVNDFIVWALCCFMVSAWNDVFLCYLPSAYFSQVEVSGLSLKVDLLVNIISKYELLTAIPFLITLFYFFYRQQRQIAESYVLRLEICNFTLFSALLLIVFNIRLCMYDVSAMTGFVLVVYASSLLWMFLFVKYIFKQIHASVLHRNFYDAIINNMSYWRKLSRYRFIETVLLERLAWRLEVFYQIEFYMIKNNMSVINKTRHSQLKEIFKCFIREVLVKGDKSFDDTSKVYIDIYRELLRFQKKMAILLYESYESSGYQYAVDVLQSAYPGDFEESIGENSNKFFDEYFKAIWSLAVYFSERDRNNFQKLLQELLKVKGNIRSNYNIVILYRALLIDAIYKNNMNFITEVCYRQKDIAEKMQHNDESTEVNVIASKFAKYHSGDDYVCMLLYVLICGLVKSIELGESKIAGFLVKFIVSNYASDDICKVYDKVVQKKCVDCLENSVFATRLGVSFNLNDGIVIYCLKKATLLLRCQQCYRSNGEEIVSLEIFSAYPKDMYDLKYCAEKILNGKNDYGMISLSKENMYC